MCRIIEISGICDLSFPDKGIKVYSGKKFLRKPVKRITCSTCHPCICPLVEKKFGRNGVPFLLTFGLKPFKCILCFAMMDYRQCMSH